MYSIKDTKDTKDPKGGGDWGTPPPTSIENPKIYKANIQSARKRNTI